MSRKLTLKTTLDALRKDAKRWLKALRAGDAKARARLAAVWPKAPAQPILRDVQHALALEYGKMDWKALTAALDDLAIDRQSLAEKVEAVLRHGWDGDRLVARRIFERHPVIARDSLFTAATCGDVEEVRRRLAADPRAATRVGGSRNWTALAYCVYGRLDAVNAVEISCLLLDAGADPNFQFDDGWGCPFKVVTGAIGLGEGLKPPHPQALELVELLIERGADPLDAQALYNTSISGDDTFWTDLLWRHCEARGQADRWRSNTGQSLGGNMQVSTLNYLLGNAVGSNDPRRTAWLLDHGADPNTPHAYTRRPVHVVAQLSGYAAIKALLERHGAKPVALRGPEAFQAACLAADEDTVRSMVRADPTLTASPAPLLAAATFGHAGAVRLLLELGAPVGAVDHEGISPLHRAVQSASLETVDLLIAAGAVIDLHEKKWNGTPLSWAVVLGRPRIAERLAPLSRHVGALTAMGDTARLAAVLHDDPGLAREVFSKDERPTALFCLPADEDIASDAARILLAAGIDTRPRNPNGRTAEQEARFRGLDEAADLIAEGGLP